MNLKRFTMKTLSSFFILFLLLPVSATAQRQIGDDIIGEVPGRNFGFSVALAANGNRLVVGSPFGGRAEGFVRVFELTGDQWIQLGSDLAGRGPNDVIGRSVDISADGNRIIYGVTGNNDLTGQVRIYTWSGTQWQEEAILEGTNPQDDSFGNAVALSDDGQTAIVGAPFRQSAAGANAGDVQVFRRNGSWTETTGDFIAGGLNENVGFAVAVSADGNRIAYTSRDGTFNGSRNSGYTVVYDYVGNSWSQVGTAFGGDGEFAAVRVRALGLSLGMTPDGNTIAVGGDDTYRVVTLSGGEWIPVGDDYIRADDGPKFGENIAINDTGDRLVIVSQGAGDSDGIYMERLDNNNWTKGPADIPSTESDFGFAIARAGNTLAYSHPEAEVNGEVVGVVRVLDISTLTSTRRPLTPQVKAWPNPAEGQINVSGITFSEGQIIDAFGRIVLRTPGGGNSIDTHDLPAGSYFLRLKTDSGWATARFIRR